MAGEFGHPGAYCRRDQKDTVLPTHLLLPGGLLHRVLQLFEHPWLDAGTILSCVHESLLQKPFQPWLQNDYWNFPNRTNDLLNDRA